MLTFKSMDDLDQLSLHSPHYDIIEKIVISFVVEADRAGFPSACTSRRCASCHRRTSLLPDGSWRSRS